MMTSREFTIFGPAGNSIEFYEAGNKRSAQMPAYLKKTGLSWYEYPCGRGINVKEDTAKEIGNNAIESDIGMSVHAPYFINFANPELEKRQKSREYIYQSLNLAKNLNAQRVIFHPGSCRKISRDHAMQILLEDVKVLISEVDNLGLGDIVLCPETMGKKNQLGNLKEVLSICQLDDRLIPTIDFGHLNARRQGSLKTEDDYARILDAIENKLGNYRMKNIHIHFSHIEYTNSGERRHLTFDDKIYGPYFKDLAKQLVKRRMSAIVVCESKDVMIRDALTMKNMYQSLL